MILNFCLFLLLGIQTSIDKIYIPNGTFFSSYLSYKPIFLKGRAIWPTPGWLQKERNLLNGILRAGTKANSPDFQVLGKPETMWSSFQKKNVITFFNVLDMRENIIETLWLLSMWLSMCWKTYPWRAHWALVNKWCMGISLSLHMVDKGLINWRTIQNLLNDLSDQTERGGGQISWHL